MTPRERALAAMLGKPTDRPSCVPLVDTSYAAAVAGMAVSRCFLEPEAYAGALVATLDRHPDIDGVSINIGLCDDVIQDLSRQGDTYHARTVGGLTWSVPVNDIGSICACEVSAFDDPRFATDEYLMNACLRTLAAIPAEYRRKYLINTTVTGPFSQVAFLVGVDNLMLGTVDDPAGLQRAIEHRVPFALDWVDRLVKLDPGCVWIGEGFASNSLISTDTYVQFVQPYERRVIERIHEKGLASVIHICGKLGRTLEAIADTGADCAEVDWQVDLADARGRVCDRMTLKGNLNTTNLVQSSPDEVFALATAALQASRGGRFILSSGCCLGRDTPPESVDAMVRACKEFPAG